MRKCRKENFRYILPPPLLTFFNLSLFFYFSLKRHLSYLSHKLSDKISVYIDGRSSYIAENATLVYAWFSSFTGKVSFAHWRYPFFAEINFRAGGRYSYTQHNISCLHCQLFTLYRKQTLYTLYTFEQSSLEKRYLPNCMRQTYLSQVASFFMGEAVIFKFNKPINYAYTYLSRSFYQSAWKNLADRTIELINHDDINL